MREAHWHVFQVLTKRADRLHRMLGGVHAPFAKLPNIWWGVSVEKRKHGVPRIALLQDGPAAVRFLSIEQQLPASGAPSLITEGLRGTDWVIVGGESGPGARPMEREWVVSLRDQCRAARVPFFKQWGGVQRKKRGRESDGRVYSAFPLACVGALGIKPRGDGPGTTRLEAMMQALCCLFVYFE